MHIFISNVYCMNHVARKTKISYSIKKIEYKIWNKFDKIDLICYGSINRIVPYKLFNKWNLILKHLSFFRLRFSYNHFVSLYIHSHHFFFILFLFLFFFLSLLIFLSISFVLFFTFLFLIFLSFSFYLFSLLFQSLCAFSPLWFCSYLLCFYFSVFLFFYFTIFFFLSLLQFSLSTTHFFWFF